MTIDLGCFTYKLSGAQARVVRLLNGMPDRFVIPTEYYNHQDIKGSDGFFTQFKMPTLEFLRKRQILIPNGDRNYLKLSPLVKIIKDT